MTLRIRRPGLVVPVPVDAAGLMGPTKGLARGPRWRRTSPGLYVPSSTDSSDVGQRIVEAAAGGLEGSAVTGWAALHWQGAEWFAGQSSDGRPLPVPLALGDKKMPARRAGVLFCHDWLFEGDVLEDDGVPVTRPERSVCAAALRARSFEETVQVIDMALASDLVSLGELNQYAALLRGRPHTRRLNSALLVAEENVWSPLEVTMRLRWLARRPVTLLCNQPLFTAAGEHLLTPDLFDPVHGLAGEYDGHVHDATRVRRRDLDREERARSVGVQIVAMASADLRDAASFERRLDAAYARATASAGLWTTTPPAWWTDTTTVASRRALSLHQRETLLRRHSA